MRLPRLFMITALELNDMRPPPKNRMMGRRDDLAARPADHEQSFMDLDDPAQVMPGLGFIKKKTIPGAEVEIPQNIPHGLPMRGEHGPHLDERP